MKIHYDSGQDQLHVAFVEASGFESEEVAEGIMFDYDKTGRLSVSILNVRWVECIFRRTHDVI